VNGAAAVVLALWIAHQGRKARGLAGIRRGPNNIPS